MNYCCFWYTCLWACLSGILPTVLIFITPQSAESLLPGHTFCTIYMVPCACNKPDQQDSPLWAEGRQRTISTQQTTRSTQKTEAYTGQMYNFQETPYQSAVSHASPQRFLLPIFIRLLFCWGCDVEDSLRTKERREEGKRPDVEWPSRCVVHSPRFFSSIVFLFSSFYTSLPGLFQLQPSPHRLLPLPHSLLLVDPLFSTSMGAVPLLILASVLHSYV